ncbi:hypothetical protein AX14_010511 [Amanita brunnescens Koide BX004]|nr:hypothetical protein AX14_010511 [Amanita brunnescens Koide BX004]
MTHWMILVSDPGKVEEIRRAPDDVLSIRHASRDTLDLGLGFTFESSDDLAHLVRSPLTRNIEVRFPDVRDEIIAAFSDHIPAKNDEWIKVTAYSTIMDIVCRASNRMLVGLPLCRDPDYLELNKQFTIDLVKASYILNIVPPILKPFVKPFLNVKQGVKRGMRHLGPIVKEREEQEARHGKDWAERPVSTPNPFLVITLTLSYAE